MRNRIPQKTAHSASCMISTCLKLKNGSEIRIFKGNLKISIKNKKVLLRKMSALCKGFEISFFLLWQIFFLVENDNNRKSG